MSFLDQALNLLPLAAVTPLTEQERNIVTIPAGPPATVRNGALTHADAGPPGGEGPPQRLVAVLGPGATFAGIADALAPLYATAAGEGGPAAPSVDELARAIAVYAKDYLAAEASWQFHAVGVILPLPVEIDHDAWIVDADRVRELSAAFDAAWRPRLRTPPAALAVPDALDLETAAASLAGTGTGAGAGTGAGPDAQSLGAQLWTQALRNPSGAVLMFLAALRALDRAAAGQAATAALTALSAATADQLSVLAATSAGNAILRRFTALLTPPPAGADPGLATLLDDALHQGSGAQRSLAVHHDVPETAAQQASRPGTARPVEGAAADPPGGVHRLVLGHDLSVGRTATASANGMTFTGPEFGGRVALQPYLMADTAGLNPSMDPMTTASLTLLGNDADPGSQDQVRRLDAVAAMNASLLTAGLDQLGATDAAGLPALLFAYKTAAPDEFDLFFALHGLDVQQGPDGHQFLLLGPDGTGTVPDSDALRTFFGGTADANGAVTFGSDWAARFRLPAVVSAAHRRVQVAQAAPRAAAAADPLKQHAASVLPFPAAAYKLDLDLTQTPGTLGDKLTVKMTGGADPPAAASVIGVAKTHLASDANTLASAVVDLTGNPATPPYAGFFSDEKYFVGSLAKILPMYAAHELRFRVQQVVTSIKRDGLAATPQKIFDAIARAWGPQVCRAFGDFPALDVRYPGRFPKLAKMFSIGDDDTVRFLKPADPALPGATEDDIARVGENNPPTPQMTFYHWQKLMILWSNNTAAGLTISTINYPYINRLLRQAGFYHTDTKLGLWISGNYTGDDWVRGADLMPLTGRGKLHYKATSNFVATAREVARLLTLAQRHKLFDADAPTSLDMIELMRKTFVNASPPPDRGGGAIAGGPGTSTFIGDALGLSDTDADTISSKIGIGVPSPTTGLVGVHDCGIVSRTEAAKPLRFVAVVLGGFSAGADSDAWDETARALDAVVLASH